MAALKLGLATQAFGMTSGAFGWSKKNIIWKHLIFAAIASGIGMYVGTYEVIISGKFIKMMFGWVSICIFFVILIEIRYGDLSHDLIIKKDSFLKLSLYILVCFIGGMVTAWTAVCIGEAVALYMLLVYRIRTETAIGTGVAALAIDSIIGLVFHTQIGAIEWEFLAFTVPGVILGGFFGARMGKIVEERVRIQHAQQPESDEIHHSPLKWLFAVVILIDGLAMLVHTYLF